MTVREDIHVVVVYCSILQSQIQLEDIPFL